MSDKVVWESVKWPDGSRYEIVYCERRGGKIENMMTIRRSSHRFLSTPCRYEGLVKNDKCHVRGVFSYADGDKYVL